MREKEANSNNKGGDDARKHDEVIFSGDTIRLRSQETRCFL